MHDRRPLPPPDRLFVVFTIAEAEGLCLPLVLDNPNGLRGLAKIRTALDCASSVVTQPGDEQLSTEHPTPPLRAKDYQPRDRTQHVRSKAPMAKAEMRVRLKPDATATKTRDRTDYVPWRDEANGVWE